MPMQLQAQAPPRHIPFFFVFCFFFLFFFFFFFFFFVFFFVFLVGVFFFFCFFFFFMLQRGTFPPPSSKQHVFGRYAEFLAKNDVLISFCGCLATFFLYAPFSFHLRKLLASWTMAILEEEDFEFTTTSFFLSHHFGVPSDPPTKGSTVTDRVVPLSASGTPPYISRLPFDSLPYFSSFFLSIEEVSQEASSIRRFPLISEGEESDDFLRSPNRSCADFR